MSWLDLASPALQKDMRLWCDVRSSRRTPPVESFDQFISQVDPNFLVTVAANKKRECVFVSIGSFCSEMFPGCVVGMRFSKISPLPTRLGISRFFQEVMVSRMPASRRGSCPKGESNFFYEQLFLPFTDKDFDVARIAVIADGYASKSPSKSGVAA